MKHSCVSVERMNITKRKENWAKGLPVGRGRERKVLYAADENDNLLSACCMSVSVLGTLHTLAHLLVEGECFFLTRKGIMIGIKGNN